MRRIKAGLAAFAACLSCAAAGQAQVVNLRNTVINGEKKSLIQSVKFGGDLRLRHDTIDHQTVYRYTAAGTPGTTAQVTRQQERFRLRVGAEVGLPYDLTVSMGLASGTGEQTSTNQTYNSLASEKGIYIDYSYLQWAPKFSENAGAFLASGKMKNPIWRIYSSDLVWDSDLNPEGFAEGFEGFVAPLGGIFFANALQWSVQEASSNKDQNWMLGQQIGAEYRLPLSSRIRLAAAYYRWTNVRNNTLGQVKTHDGNRRDSAGILQNNFGVGEVTGELSGWISRVPVRVQGTAIQNFSAMALYTPRNNMGYQTGAILGESKEKNSWELAYFYKWLETDATLADVADSDFGDGGTNRRGHILWAAYSPLDWMELKTKFFHTRTLAEGLSPYRNDINRFQLDMTVKF